MSGTSTSLVIGTNEATGSIAVPPSTLGSTVITEPV